MSIERWTIRSSHDFTDHETGESYRLACRVRGPELREEVEVVRASDYEGAVQDVAALKAALIDVAQTAHEHGPDGRLAKAKRALNHLGGQSAALPSSQPANGDDR